jgi:formylglycine-generating enzyme
MCEAETTNHAGFRFALNTLGLTIVFVLVASGCQRESARANANSRESASAVPPENARPETAAPAHDSSSIDVIGFQPTKVNKDEPTLGLSAEGMVWIPGGEFSMGANEPPDGDDVGMHATTDARPIHRVYVDGFYMDKTDVTNAQFAKFVKATGHK